MHISDGILTETAAGTAALIITSAAAAGGVAIGLRRMDYERVARAAVLSAAFFVASLVHVRIGISSVHLILNGLVSIILGWAAFPAFLVGLVLQAIFFGHGGVTTIGLNTFNFGCAGLLCFILFKGRILRTTSPRAAFAWGALAGTASMLLAALLIVAELLVTGEELSYLAGAFLLAHLPVALAEGLITGAVIGFLKRVEPRLLTAPTDDRG